MAKETSSDTTGTIQVEAEIGEVSGYAKITAPEGNLMALYNGKGQGGTVMANGNIMPIDENTAREAIDAIRNIAKNGPIENANATALCTLVADLKDNGKLDKSVDKGQCR